MHTEFSRTLSLLRREKGVSQRTAAKALDISQALLSHYENGAREPGLAFVVRACAYYQVSADFLLGRTMMRDGTSVSADELPDVSAQNDPVLRGSAAALLAKKLVTGSISVIFDLCGRSGSLELVTAVSRYFCAAVYRVFRGLYAVAGPNEKTYFSVPAALCPPASQCEMNAAEIQMQRALSGKPTLPDMSQQALQRTYPMLLTPLLTLLHQTGERIQKHM